MNWGYSCLPLRWNTITQTTRKYRVRIFCYLDVKYDCLFPFYPVSFLNHEYGKLHIKIYYFYRPSMFKLVVQLVIRKFQWIKNFCRKLKHVEIHILVFAKIKIFSTISSALENSCHIHCISNGLFFFECHVVF